MSTVSTSVGVPELHRARLLTAADAIGTGMDSLAPAFVLKRRVDHSGVSGTGNVAEGIQLPSGLVVMWWTVPDKPSTCTLFGSPEEAGFLHGHHGDSRITWRTNRTAA